ncbi:hypothetical protein FBU59_000875, partial [Linderina macrospora]
KDGADYIARVEAYATYFKFEEDTWGEHLMTYLSEDDHFLMAASLKEEEFKDWAKLLHYIGKDWAMDIKDRITGTESFDALFKTVRDYAASQEKKDEWYEEVFMDSEDKELKADEPAKETTPTKQVQPGDVIGELSEKFEKLMINAVQRFAANTANVNSTTKAPNAQQAKCYYCAQEGHRVRDCEYRRQDEHDGLIKIVNGFCCDANGKPLRRDNSSGMMASVNRPTTVGVVNDIRFAEMVDLDDEMGIGKDQYDDEAFNVDVNKRVRDLTQEEINDKSCTSNNCD